MNLKQLEHLLAVAEAHSFSRAADRLHLTQSALSRSIQLLEEDLEARLIDRMGKRNELTPLGEIVAARARRLLVQAEDLRRSVALASKGNAGPIRVGLGAGPGALLMTPFLIHMAKQHPQVHVTITRGSIELQLIQLRERYLDALVIDAHNVPPASDLVTEDAAQMRAAFICRNAHPLLTRRRRPAPVRFDQMLPYGLASVPLATEIAQGLIQKFGPQADPQQAVRLCCEDAESLIATVRQSDVIYFGIVATARAAIASGDLVELATDPPLIANARYAIVTLLGRTESPSMKLFRSFVADRLRD